MFILFTFTINNYASLKKFVSLPTYVCTKKVICTTINKNLYTKNLITMADSKEKLFSDFPAVSTQEWMDKITADLKGG